MRFSKEFKIGFFIVLALAALYWGINFLKGNDVLASSTEFYAVYNNTEGLTPAKAVQINGLQVGLIDDIYFHPTRSGKLIVKMKLQKNFPIPADSKAQIHSSGLLGEKSIKLILGTSPNELQNGDTLQAGSESSLSAAVNEQVAPLKAKAEDLLESLDTVAVLLTGFLNNQNKDDLGSSISSLNRTMHNLEHSSSILESVLSTNQNEFTNLFENLASISENLKNNNENISGVLGNLNQITDSLNRANIGNTFTKVNNAVTELDSTLQKINSGTGTLAQLVNNPQLYNNLESAAENLDRLLLDIKYNPKKYVNVSVFGKKGEKLSEDEIDALEAERTKQTNTK